MLSRKDLIAFSTAASTLVAPAAATAQDCELPTRVPAELYRMNVMSVPLVNEEGAPIGVSIVRMRQVFGHSLITLDYARQQICFAFASNMEGVSVAPRGPKCFNVAEGATPAAGESPFTVIATFPASEDADPKNPQPNVLPVVTMTPERARGIYNDILNTCPSQEI